MKGHSSTKQQHETKHNTTQHNNTTQHYAGTSYNNTSQHIDSVYIPCKDIAYTKI